MIKIQSKQRVYQNPMGKTVSVPALHKGRNGHFKSGSVDIINQAGLIVLDGMGAGGSVVMRLQMSCEEAEQIHDEIRAALSKYDYVTERDQLILDLWSFIENSGSTEEFFALRERVREVMK